MDSLLSGDAGGRRRRHPPGARQQGISGAGKGALGSQEEQGVGSDSEGGGGFHRAGAAAEGSASSAARRSPICSRARWLRRAARTSARYFLRSASVAFFEGLGRVGVWRKATGNTRQEPSGAGRAREVCRKRCARTKLVWKCGPRGSRRQATPGVRRPERRRSVSSRTAQTGAWAGNSASTARRTTEKMVSTGRRSREKSR